LKNSCFEEVEGSISMVDKSLEKRYNIRVVRNVFERRKKV
jgi:hypothetical protein